MAKKKTKETEEMVEYEEVYYPEFRFSDLIAFAVGAGVGRVVMREAVTPSIPNRDAAWVVGMVGTLSAGYFVEQLWVRYSL